MVGSENTKIEDMVVRRMNCVLFSHPHSQSVNRFVSALAILAAFVCQSTAEDWPQFRGPTGDGVSKARNVPLTWSATDHVVWKKPIPGSGWSSPVLFRGKLYLTTAVDLGSDQVSL